MKKFAVSLSVFFLCVLSAFAINYGIDEYRVQVVVGKDAVHSVSEDIAMNFHTPGHGFYRDIPVLFEGSPVRAKVRNVKCSDPYETEYDNGYFSMKIGDGDKEIKGVKNYKISYNYDLGIDINKGYDEFYFDLLGNAWECNVEDFYYEIYLPSEGLGPDDVKAWVTYGSYGSSQQLHYSVGEVDGYYVLYGAVSGLQARHAVTVRIQLPEGWYVGAREPWDLTGLFKIVAPVVSLILVAVAFALWSAFGKDKTPIITAKFNPPENFSPMIVGYLADGSVDDKDIISMIFNWADRGLLTINEKKKDKFTFTKLRDIEEDAPKSERDLFNAFFRRCKTGGEQTLSKLQSNNFAQDMVKAKVAVAKIFTKDKALHSKKARGFAVLTGFATPLPLIMLCAAFLFSEYNLETFCACLVISIFVSLIQILIQHVIFDKWYLRKSNIVACIFGFVPALAICILAIAFSGNLLLSVICALANYGLAIFAVITGKRSEYGQKLFEDVLGYREFIDKVSMDELRLMIEKDPDIYYRVLSYAVVLGLEEKWSKKFKDIALAQPSWYTGSRAIDAMYYSRMAGRMRTVVLANSFTKTSGAKVGGGGFNSVGFAGGGFGGGGGHAW